MDINTNQISQVISLITNELGKGVETAKPLALEVVRQYRARESMYIIVSFFICLIASGITAFLIEFLKKNYSIMGDESIIISFLAIVICTIVAFVSFLCGIGSLGNYIAPLPSMLGK
jgi:hypothetical protein